MRLLHFIVCCLFCFALLFWHGYFNNVRAADLITKGSWVDVRAYGAVGDGSTNDTAAIQAAWDNIFRTGGTLFFPRGTYKITSSLNFSTGSQDFTKSFIIKGVGKKASVISSKDLSIAIDLGGTNNVTIEDIGIRDVGKNAKVAIARYRVAGGVDGGHYHAYRNVDIIGSYSIAGIYSIGSEVNDHYFLTIQNTGNGAAYATDENNHLGLTGTAQRVVTTGSNTVNNFYGGYMWGGSAGTTGGALFFPTGNADNYNFYGTYFNAFDNTGYSIKLGDGTGYVQGRKVFEGCRFEGSADTFKIYTDEVETLTIKHCHFGQNSGYRDINWITGGADAGNSPTIGLINADIQDNKHYENRGMVIPLITGSTIRVPSYNPGWNYFLSSTIAIGNSFIEIDNLVLGKNAIMYGSFYRKNKYTTASRDYYGPSTTNPNFGSPVALGSALINRPFSLEPSVKDTGTLVTATNDAGGANWQPFGTGYTSPIPIFYDGTRWLSLIPLSVTPTSKTAACLKGNVAFDNNYLYWCYTDNNWRRVVYDNTW